MNQFDNIIGYQSVKNEVRRICDVVKDSEKYKKLGIELPKGLLLHGVPRVGKTLFADAFISECNRTAFVCRKNLPENEFVKFLKGMFEEAKQKTPSVILLDDVDKFASVNEDCDNAEKCAVLQSCIDDIKNSDVLL